MGPSPYIVIEDENEITYTIFDMATRKPIVYPTRELTELSMDETSEMCAMLDSVDPSEWRKPPIFIRHLLKPSTYLALEEQTGKFVWKASRYVHRFISRGEAAAVLKDSDIEGIVEDKTWEIPDDKWV